MLAATRRGAELIVVGRESIEGVNRGSAWIRAAGGTSERAERSDFGLRGQELRAVASTSDGLLVAVGWDDNRTGTPRAAVWTSRDGRSWQRGRGPPQARGATQMYGVTVAGDRIVAVGRERTGSGAAARLWSAARP